MIRRTFRLDDEVVENIQEIMQEYNFSSENQTINFIISDYNKKRKMIEMKEEYIDKKMTPVIASQRQVEEDIFLIKTLLNTLMHEFPGTTEIFPADKYEGAIKHHTLVLAENRYRKILNGLKEEKYNTLLNNVEKEIEHFEF